MIAGAADRIDRGRGGQRREQQRPGRDARRRGVERGERDIAFQEAQALRVEQRAGIVLDLADVEHVQRGVRTEGVGRPVLEARTRVDIEREGRRNGSVDAAVIGLATVVDAVRREQHGARVDQRAGADEAVVAEEHADAVHATRIVDDLGRRLVVVRNDGERRGRSQRNSHGRRRASAQNRLV